MQLHYTALWEAIRARLNTALMQQILGGPNRVYLESEDYSQPEGPENGEWGRVVIVPSSNIWGATDSVGPTRETAFMVRGELSDYKKQGYDYTIPLDAMQDEAENQLNGWCPSGLVRINVLLPIYLFSARQPLPLWDDDRGLHFNSSQYRTEINKT